MLLLEFVIVRESIDWAQLDGETALVLRQRSCTVSVIVGQTWRSLLLCGGPTALIINFMQVLPVCERYNLLLETESVDQ